MAVVAIVVVISALVIVGHANFRGSILLSNLTYEVALSIREAQVFGLGAREATISGSDFDTGYGIHFDRNTPDAYTLFADLNRDLDFDEDTETVHIYTLRENYTIGRFCVVLSGGGQSCSDGSLDSMSIIFDRPEPDAIIRAGAQQYPEAHITVRSPQGNERSIEVTATGQIAVEDPTL
jgi:hypothetical protein